MHGIIKVITYYIASVHYASLISIPFCACCAVQITPVFSGLASLTFSTSSSSLAWSILSPSSLTRDFISPGQFSAEREK